MPENAVMATSMRWPCHCVCVANTRGEVHSVNLCTYHSEIVKVSIDDIVRIIDNSQYKEEEGSDDAS